MSTRRNSKRRVRASTSADPHGAQPDDFKQMWALEKEKMKQEVDAEMKKKYDMQRRKLEQEKKKFDKVQSKFNKEKKDVNRLKAQLDAEKRIFTQSMRKSRNKDFNPKDMIKDIENKIKELELSKVQAKEEWDKVNAYKMKEEAAIDDQKNKMKMEWDSMEDMLSKHEYDKSNLETLMNQHIDDMKNIEKRRQDLQEADKAIEDAIVKLQMREVNLQKHEEQLSRKWEEYKRSQEKLSKKQLKVDEWESDLLKKKNVYDTIEINQQSKERELKHLESKIALNMKSLETQQKNWDNEQKQIYFDNMFAGQRAQLQKEVQEFQKEKAKLDKISNEQEALRVNLQKKVEDIEENTKQLQSMKMELDKQLHEIDKKCAENAIAEEELNLSRKVLFNSESRQLDFERELKIQRDQINLEHQQFKDEWEKQLREELSVEKAQLAEMRKNLDREASRQKNQKTSLMREKLSFKKLRDQKEEETKRQKLEILRMKKEVEISREQFKEDKKIIEDQKLQAFLQLEQIEKDRNELEADREVVRETVEKEVLDKYKTMMSYAEKNRNAVTQDQEDVAAERKKLRLEKLEFEEQRENFDLEIKQRVKSRVAEQEMDLVRKEKELTEKSGQIRVEWEKIHEEELKIEKAQREVNKMKRDSEELNQEANEMLQEASEKMEAVGIEKRSLEEKHRKVESKLKELAIKEELWSEKKELLAIERNKSDSSLVKFSELSSNTIPEIVTLKDQVSSLEKSNKVFNSQLDLIRKELHESKENFRSYVINVKKIPSDIRIPNVNYGDDEGCPSGRTSPTDRNPDTKGEYWMDDKLGENLPSIPVKLSDKDLVGKRDSMLMSRTEWVLSSFWDEIMSNAYCGESLGSESLLDQTSYVGSGFSKPMKGTVIINSAAGARRSIPTQPGQAPSIKSDDGEIQKQPSNFFLNLIESGDHLSTVFFFLGSERKVVKAIKGIISKASPILKELVQETDTVELPDLTFEGFDAMLKFIYSKACSWSIKSLIPTMACASKFGLNQLYRACFDWLEVNILPEDAMKVLDDCYKYGEVLGETAKHAAEKASWDIIISDGSEEEAVISKIFVNHSSDWVKNVLKSCSLVCSEDVMFDAVAQWATEKANRRFPENKSVYPEDWRVTADEEKCPPGKHVTKTEVVKNLLPMVQFIRFPAMPSEYITTNGLIGALLQPMEILDILRYQLDSHSCNMRFSSIPRYKVIDVSNEGCCAQSSEHFATLDYEPKLLKFETGEADYPFKISGNMLGKVLRAELALARCVYHNNAVVEGPGGLDVAQTKLDFQPWWDLDLGRLRRIQRVQVLLGAPGKIPGLTETNNSTMDMFPLALCLGRASFPALEGTLTASIQMSVKRKVFEKAPAGNPVELEWEPALVAARTLRIQCAKSTILRIMNVTIFSAEPIVTSLPCYLERKPDI